MLAATPLAQLPTASGQQSWLRHLGLETIRRMDPVSAGGLPRIWAGAPTLIKLS
jgi:hypothetical protein